MSERWMSVCTHLIMASRDCARRPKHRSNPPIAGSKSGVTTQCPSRNVCACINTFSFGHDRGRSRHLVLKRSIRRYAFVWPFEETRSPRNSPRNFACVPCGTQAFLFITGRAARTVNVSRRRSSRGSARRSVWPGFEHCEAVRTLLHARGASRRRRPEETYGNRLAESSDQLSCPACCIAMYAIGIEPRAI